MAFFDYHSPTPSSDFSTMLSAWQVRVQNKVSSVLRASKLRPDIGIDKYIGGGFFLLFNSSCRIHEGSVTSVTAGWLCRQLKGVVWRTDGL